MREDYARLISGSDLRGIAIASGDHKVTLTDEAAYRAAYAFVTQILAKETGRLRVAVGHDSRLSAPRLKAAVIAGLHRAGAEIVDCGLCTTPAMFHCTIDKGLDCVGAVMITASHLPYDRNGLKFMAATGGLDHQEIQRIALHMSEDTQPIQSAEGAQIESVDYLERYAASLREMMSNALNAEKPLAGMHIIVDAGNGASGYFARQVLEALGADISGSLFLDPDGSFPNHAPNPEDRNAMEALAQGVREQGADMGIAFDADGDRAAFVDGTGRAINRNRLVALTAAIVLEQHPGAAIVTDSTTSSGLAAFIHALGGRHIRYKRGYKNVIEEARRLNRQGTDCPLAIETSGHAAFRENRFLDDGAYLAAWLLVQSAKCQKAGRSLFDILTTLQEPVEEVELRIPILATDFSKTGQRAIDRITHKAHQDPKAHVAPDNYEGVRVSFDIGDRAEAAWLLLRQSVHDPVMPLNVESDVQGGLIPLVQFVAEALESETELDISPLTQFVQKETLYKAIKH